jgi:hypothetical protein
LPSHRVQIHFQLNFKSKETPGYPRKSRYAMQRMWAVFQQRNHNQSLRAST